MEIIPDILEDESDNAFLRRKKRSVVKYFKPTQAKRIHEANYLAVYLIALGRAQEAIRLLRSYAEHIEYKELWWERWQAQGEALLLLAHLEAAGSNKAEAERLTSSVFENDYNLTESDKRAQFWETIEGINGNESMIEAYEIGHSDTCAIYAEGFAMLVYFDRLMPLLADFQDSDRLMLDAAMSGLLRRLGKTINGEPLDASDKVTAQVIAREKITDLAEEVESLAGEALAAAEAPIEWTQMRQSAENARYFVNAPTSVSSFRVGTKKANLQALDISLWAPVEETQEYEVRGKPVISTNFLIAYEIRGAVNFRRVGYGDNLFEALIDVVSGSLGILRHYKDETRMNFYRLNDERDWVKVALAELFQGLTFAAY